MIFNIFSHYRDGNVGKLTDRPECVYDSFCFLLFLVPLLNLVQIKAARNISKFHPAYFDSLHLVQIIAPSILYKIF